MSTLLLHVVHEQILSLSKLRKLISVIIGHTGCMFPDTEVHLHLIQCYDVALILIERCSKVVELLDRLSVTDEITMSSVTYSSRSKVSSASTIDDSSFSMVAAIDIGTSTSGYAYCYR